MRYPHLPSVIKDFSLNTLFFFQDLKNIFHFFPTSMIFNEKCIFICCVCVFVVMPCFSLTSFEIFDFSLQKFNYDEFWCEFFAFILLVVHFWSICFYLSPNLGNFQPLLFWISFNPTFLLFTFWSSKVTNINSLFSYWFLRACFLYLFRLFFLFSNWIHFIGQSSPLLIPLDCWFLPMSF